MEFDKETERLCRGAISDLMDYDRFLWTTNKKLNDIERRKVLECLVDAMFFIAYEGKVGHELDELHEVFYDLVGELVLLKLPCSEKDNKELTDKVGDLVTKKFVNKVKEIMVSEECEDEEE